jgi:hypothetical protein
MIISILKTTVVQCHAYGIKIITSLHYVINKDVIKFSYI